MPDVFLDTDVAFDIISKRKPHFETSIKLLELATLGKLRLMLSESSLSTLFYLAFDIYKIEKADEKLFQFISACTVVHGGKTSALQALQSRIKDKEDAFQYFTALQAGADGLITRNIKDYKPVSPNLQVYTPSGFLITLES